MYNTSEFESCRNIYWNKLKNGRVTEILPLSTRQQKSGKVLSMALWEPGFLFSAKMRF